MQQLTQAEKLAYVGAVAAHGGYDASDVRGYDALEYSGQSSDLDRYFNLFHNKQMDELDLFPLSVQENGVETLSWEQQKHAEVLVCEMYRSGVEAQSGCAHISTLLLTPGGARPV